MIWIFAVFVYAFFIYGIIEFVRNMFLDLAKGKAINVNHRIEVLANSADGLEYIISSLKKDFNHIVLVLEREDEEILKIINSIRDEIQIEYRIESNLGEAEKSQEDF